MNGKLKILITGKNRRIATDICIHCTDDRGYRCILCHPDKEEIFDAIYEEAPNVVIICMNKESRDEIMNYEVLKEYSKQNGVYIFVVANFVDKELFKNTSSLYRAYFVSRPISMFSLYEKLSMIEDRLEELEEEGDDLSGEYISNNATADNSRRKVLVVDDDTDQLIYIRDILKDFYDVSIVKSGEAALKILYKKHIDIILLDYMMPDMTGPEVLNVIREREELSHIPVVFLTGVSEKNTVIKLLTVYKPNGYLVKPVKKSELVAKIIEVLE